MKRFNNRILIILLLFLAAAFVLTKVFRSPALERNLNDDLLRIDTASITAIKLYPASEQRKEIALVRQGKGWNVILDNKSVKAEAVRVKDLLLSMGQVEVDRMVSRRKEKWDSYNVGDTSAIQLIAVDGSNELINLYIGKQQGTSTYVRLNDADEVYEVSGLPRSTVDKKFKDWRDKSFLRTDRNAITKITFKYPADSGFVVEKRDNVWMIANERADSTSIENYLNKLRSKDIGSFADDFKPSDSPDVTVTIESSTNPVATINGWKPSFYRWILSSSRQPDTYFSDEGQVVARELFPGRKTFFGTE
jgi:hypothetical protein